MKKLTNLLGVTTLAVWLSASTLAAPSEKSHLEPASNEFVAPRYRVTGYAPYLQDTPVKALDATVYNLPEYTKPTLYMSRDGLFRYAYFQKTGKWLEGNEAKKAMRDPYDQGNW